MTRPPVTDLAFTANDCFTASYGTVLRLLDRSPAVLGCEFGFRWLPAAAQPSIVQLEIARRGPEDIIGHWYPEVRVVGTRHADDAALWRHLCSVAAPTRPVVIAVDCYDLPYSTHYRSMHLGHRLVVLDASDAGVEIIDAYRGAAFVGRVEPDLVTTALAAMSSNGDVAPESVEVSAATPPAGSALAPERVKVALRSSAALVLSDRASDIPEGRRAVAELVAFLAAHTDDGALDQAEFVEILARLGELASQRAANAQFLTAAADVLSAPALMSVADQASRAGRAWFSLRNVFYMRAARSNAVPARLVDRLHDCAALDVSMSEQIMDVVGA